MTLLAPAALCLMVLAATDPAAVDFDSQIIPILTKSGCNSGACHGAAAGRGGLHLSLWGSDPSADYESLVRALEGRRINREAPERSLLLRKPTGQIDHGGGMRFPADGPAAARLAAWIRNGAPRGSSVRLLGLDVQPRKVITATVPETFRFRIEASFDNGAIDDVTAWTDFRVTDSSALRLEENGLVTVLRPGQHAVLIRFLDCVVAIPVIAADPDLPPLSHMPRPLNPLDDIANRPLQQLRLTAAEAVDDAGYLRRVSLDLTGRLPDPDETQAFLADTAVDRRSRLVDRLLASPAYTDLWTLRFARWLQLHSLPRETEGLRACSQWLAEVIRSGEGLDTMAVALLTATGDSHVVGPANFARMVPDARAQAELVGQFFFGVRLGCANCHNHPLDRWTQDDYHGLAAIFARVERSRHVTLAARGFVTNPRTREPAIPRIPGVGPVADHADPREALAHWIVTDGRSTYGKALGNRLWKSLLGRGLVEPVDDLSQTNPPSNPELLDRLADEFIARGFDLRSMIRQIVLSQTYSRASAPANPLEERFATRALRRRLEPEVLLDLISDVTGVPESFGDDATFTRAVTVIDPLVPSATLDLLGRCSRPASCDTQAPNDGLATQLHFLNGALINHRVQAPQGRLRQLLAAGRTDAEILSEFWLHALCRTPTAAELDRWEALLSVPGAPREILFEDFLWSLLNSPAVIENY